MASSRDLVAEAALREQLRRDVEREFRSVMAEKVKRAADIGRRYADREVARLRLQLEEAESRHAAKVAELRAGGAPAPLQSPIDQRDMMDTMMRVSLMMYIPSDPRPQSSSFCYHYPTLSIGFFQSRISSSSFCLLRP
jgi:hypothetical protein